MIANFFNKTKPIVFFILASLLFVYYILAIANFKFEAFSFLWLAQQFGFFVLIIGFLLISSFIIKKNTLTQNNSYALLLLVLLLGTFYEAMFDVPIVIANVFLLLGFRKVYSLRTISATKLKLFDAGFWFGVAALFYAWSIIFVLLIYVALIIFERINVKNLIRPIVGVITPIFIYFIYCFAFGSVNDFYNCWEFNFNVNYTSYNNLKLLLPISVSLAAVIWSIVTLTPKVSVSGIHIKRAWRIVLNHLIFAAIIIAFAPIKNGSEMLFMIFPFSVIITNYLRISPSENFKNLLLYLFLILSISVYFL
ncbi:DUF6427 family protein [Lutibacter holmesii]|uniref:DUF6427 family protein n=1 Tax=Lutibacter holmesii TaxID=1137985 RepID=A0ABW3WRN6_9FLAO